MAYARQCHWGLTPLIIPERMAKINQGIDPGDEAEAYEKDTV